MLADNPLNRMCDADSDPPPDVVTVPRDRLTELVRRFLELAEIAGQIKALAKSDERHIQDAQFRAALAELEGGAK